jgi:hypothetical protein
MHFQVSSSPRVRRARKVKSEKQMSSMRERVGGKCPLMRNLYWVSIIFVFHVPCNLIFVCAIGIHTRKKRLNEASSEQSSTDAEKETVAAKQKEIASAKPGTVFIGESRFALGRCHSREACTRLSTSVPPCSPRTIVLLSYPGVCFPDPSRGF